MVRRYDPRLGIAGRPLKMAKFNRIDYFCRNHYDPRWSLKLYPRIVGCGVAIESQSLIVKLVLVEITIIPMCLIFLRLTITFDGMGCGG